MPTKSLPEHLKSTYAEVDVLINAMLSPAPKYRGAGAYYMSSHVAGVWNAVDRVVARYKARDTSPEAKLAWMQQRQDDFENGALGISTLFKRGLYYSLPLQAVVDFSKRFGLDVQAAKLQKTIDTLAGAVHKSDLRIDAAATVFENWHKDASKDTKKIFDDIVIDSTIGHVDPSVSESVYAKDKDKLATYRAMQTSWGKLGKGGQEVYKELRDVYAKMYENLQGVINANIDSVIEDKGDAENLKKTVFQNMFEKNRITPYFPLYRKGEYWIHYNAYNDKTQTTEPVFEAYESHTARKQRIAELDKDSRVVDFADIEAKPGAAAGDTSKPKPKGKIREYVNLDNVDYTAAPSGAFMKQVLDTLNKNRPKQGSAQEVEAYDKNQDQLMKLFINTLPESSFAKSMQKRENVLGHRNDAFEAFKAKSYNLGRQVEQLKYGNEIRAVQAELTKSMLLAKDEPNGEDAKLLYNELMARADFARSPPNNFINRAAGQANRVAFLGTIGFNMSSALVNISQIPLMMLPILNGAYGGGKYGLGRKAPWKAVGRASTIIGRSGTTRKLSRVDIERGNIDVRGTPSIDNYYELKKIGDEEVLVVRKDMKLSDAQIAELNRMKTLVEVAGDRGMLGRSLFYDTLGLEKSGRERGGWDKVNAASAFVFHMAERYNRQVAMVATYDLEIQRMEKQGRKVFDKAGNIIDVAAAKEAAELALYRSQEMNGGATLSTAPRIAQQGLGRVAMMYKSYGVQMYYTLMKTGYNAFKPTKGMSADELELTRMAKEQFFGVLLSSAFLAGAQGMPFVGVLMMMANLFLDDEEDDAETLLRKHIGELAYKGPVTGLLGTDISSRIGLSNLLYRDNPYSNDESDADRLLTALGGPAWSVMTQFSRGAKDVNRGHVERGMEQMLPAAFRNIYKGFPLIGRYARDGGILTRRGDIIHDDITTGDLLGQVLGFPPTDYTRKQEINQQEVRKDRETGARRSNILKRYYVALRMGGDVSDVLQDLYDFNRRHPRVAITEDSVKRSMKKHARTSALMHNGVTISPKRRVELYESVNEYSTWGWGAD